jgi:hypothetical protein
MYLGSSSRVRSLVKRSNGLSNHHETLTLKTPNPHTINLPEKGGTTACSATPLSCRGLQYPRSVLKVGTAGYNEGITGRRRGPTGNSQEG